MKNGRILFLFIVILISCNKSSYVPPEVITPAQMQEVLWDLIRGDLLAQEIIKRDSTKTLQNETFAISEKVFLMHKINRPKFESSMAFYEKHPGLIKVIFDSLNAIKTRRHSPPAMERKLLRDKEHRLIPPENIKAR